MIQEKMMSRTLRTVFAGSMLVGMTAMMHNAVAQEAAPQKIESVQVTGTRITSPGMQSTSPIASVTAEEMKASQPVAVEEFIKTLPVAVASIGPGTNNGSAGGATIDLRGLGANRTLVMINGRRMVPFSLNGTVDTNAIPIALLSRVDLLTGGASVVYGADAVAGVINFNLKKNFSGFDATTSYGMTTGPHDGKRKRTDLTWGANLDDGRGNVVLSIGKASSDPVTQGSRSYGVTSLSSTTGLGTGSGTTIPSAFSVPRSGTAPGSDKLSGSWQIDPTTGKLVQPVVPYNTNPLNYYATGLERTQATSMANFKVNEHADVYTEVFYTTTNVASTLAESGTFGNVFDVPVGNPYIPEAARQQICERRSIPTANCVVGNTTLVPMTVNRRFVEMGPRINAFDNKTLQYTVGVKGDVAFDWVYDAYYTKGTADQVQLKQNWGSLSKVGQALNAVSTTACTNTANGCVPLNVFGGAGSITPAQLAFINQSTIQRVNVTQTVASGSLSGDFGNKFVSPWAGQPVNLAMNVEERKVSAQTRADAPSQIQGEVLGSGAPAVDSQGAFKLREYSAESIIPLIKDKSFVKALNAELGYRRTEFTNSGTKTSYGSWKVGGDWQPINALRFRANAQKATRAPNVNELYAPLVTGLSNLAADPCQGTNINTADANKAGTLSNLCRLTGVPVSEIGSLPAPSSNQINNQTGGNPKLGPEEAKTKTLGFVWEPLPKLAISVDYYKIEIDKAVSSKSTTDVLDGCYKNNPSYTFNDDCALIGRHPANGTFNGALAKGVATPQSNLGTQSTAGFDVNVAYKLTAKTLNIDPKFGSFDLNFAYNQVNDFHFKATPTSINRDCLGYYSTACANIGGTTAPVYKRKFGQRTTWNVGQFALGYNWRYQSAVDVEPGSGTFLPKFSHIEAYNYVDLSAVWNYSKNLRFNLSVNNAANKKPPIVGAGVSSTSMDSGNTFPQAYDAIGRYATFGVNVKF
ncbi:Outer membrane cobalamin receptor protein [Duganella sp. CF402]|uniref:TonB-dependent receptor domain-containing protein n=1 Tax=unclassified Duganella TaxID=2636909 RepID=UPI0008D1FF45|nr:MULTISPECIES: TonB-dependent receptor [unclassified Duganella]RZT04236.1 TonB-dependent receptor-like protein [Duganella sp. BK701]SEM43187.1 Outer membrane cobalamin receptor protein [Duganella sp. CF402]